MNGIYDKEILLIVTNYSIWPQAVNTPMIRVPVNICILMITTYTELVLDLFLFLQHGMKYSELACWYNAERMERSEKNLANGKNKIQQVLHTTKFPFLKYQSFTVII